MCKAVRINDIGTDGSSRALPTRLNAAERLLINAILSIHHRIAEPLKDTVRMVDRMAYRLFSNASRSMPVPPATPRAPPTNTPPQRPHRFRCVFTWLSLSLPGRQRTHPDVRVLRQLEGYGELHENLVLHARRLTRPQFYSWFRETTGASAMHTQWCYNILVRSYAC